LDLIERDNQALLDRIEKLGQKPVTQNNYPIQYDALEDKRSFRAHMVQMRREREARRITEENLLMLERITQVNPVYNHSKWEVRSQIYIYTLATVCHYLLYIFIRIYNYIQADAHQHEEQLRHMLIYPEVYDLRTEASRSRQGGSRVSSSQSRQVRLSSPVRAATAQPSYSSSTTTRALAYSSGSSSQRKDSDSNRRHPCDHQGSVSAR